jgi:hypothetical protein
VKYLVRQDRVGKMEEGEEEVREEDVWCLKR